MFAIAYIITAAVASFFPVSPVDLTPAGMVSSTPLTPTYPNMR